MSCNPNPLHSKNLGEECGYCEVVVGVENEGGVRDESVNRGIPTTLEEAKSYYMNAIGLKV
jgi:hypothetical protein